MIMIVIIPVERRPELDKKNRESPFLSLLDSFVMFFIKKKLSSQKSLLGFPINVLIRVLVLEQFLTQSPERA